MFSNNLIL